MEGASVAAVGHLRIHCWFACICTRLSAHSTCYSRYFFLFRFWWVKIELFKKFLICINYLWSCNWMSNFQSFSPSYILNSLFSSFCYNFRNWLFFCIIYLYWSTKVITQFKNFLCKQLYNTGNYNFRLLQWWWLLDAEKVQPDSAITNWWLTIWFHRVWRIPYQECDSSLSQ